MLWCAAVPHIVSQSARPPSQPTSTFDAAKWCATSDPQSLIGTYDPQPACGILPNQSNTLALEACCQPAPVEWSVVHCLEYCGLPLGTGYRGVGNLTFDEALGSFKTCLTQKGNGSQDGLDGVLCRVNGSAIDLKNITFATTKYLTGSGLRVSVESWIVAALIATLVVI
jgi:hypothetical protein